MIIINNQNYPSDELTHRLIRIQNTRPKPTLVGFLESCPLGRCILKIAEIFCCVDFQSYARSDYNWDDDYSFLEAMRQHEAQWNNDRRIQKEFSRAIKQYNSVTPLRHRTFSAYVPPQNASNASAETRVVAGSGAVNNGNPNSYTPKKRRKTGNDYNVLGRPVSSNAYVPPPVNNSSHQTRAPVGQHTGTTAYVPPAVNNSSTQSRAPVGQHSGTSAYVPPPVNNSFHQTRAPVGQHSDTSAYVPPPVNNSSHQTRAPVGQHTGTTAYVPPAVNNSSTQSRAPVGQHSGTSAYVPPPVNNSFHQTRAKLGDRKNE